MQARGWHVLGCQPACTHVPSAHHVLGCQPACTHAPSAHGPTCGILLRPCGYVADRKYAAACVCLSAVGHICTAHGAVREANGLPEWRCVGALARVHNLSSLWRLKLCCQPLQYLMHAQTLGSRPEPLPSRLAQQSRLRPVMNVLPRRHSRRDVCWPHREGRRDSAAQRLPGPGS